MILCKRCRVPELNNCSSKIHCDKRIFETRIERIRNEKGSVNNESNDHT